MSGHRREQPRMHPERHSARPGTSSSAVPITNYSTKMITRSITSYRMTFWDPKVKKGLPRKDKWLPYTNISKTYPVKFYSKTKILQPKISLTDITLCVFSQINTEWNSNVLILPFFIILMVRHFQFYKDMLIMRTAFYFLSSTTDRDCKTVTSGWAARGWGGHVSEVTVRNVHALGVVLVIVYVIRTHCYFTQISTFWPNWGKGHQCVLARRGNGAEAWVYCRERPRP